MGYKNEKIKDLIGENHDRFPHFYIKIKKIAEKNINMAQALLLICLSGHPEQDVSKRR